jgi:hypothetical protein
MYISFEGGGDLKENLQIQMRSVSQSDKQQVDDEQFDRKVIPGLILSARALRRSIGN